MIGLAAIAAFVCIAVSVLILFCTRNQEAAEVNDFAVGLAFMGAYLFLLSVLARFF
jgi:hypothetical protein